MRHINIPLNDEEWGIWIDYFKRNYPDSYTPPISPSKIAEIIKHDIKRKIQYEGFE